MKATHGAEPWAFRSPVDRLGGSTVVKGGRPDGSRDRLARTFQSRKKVLTCRPWDRWARAVRMAATAASKAARPLTGPALSLGSGRMPGRGWWCRAVRGQHEAGRETMLKRPLQRSPTCLADGKSAAGGPSTARTGLGSISFRDTRIRAAAKGQTAVRIRPTPWHLKAESSAGRALSSAMRQARNTARCAASNQTAPTPLLLSLSRPPRTPVAVRATSQRPVSTQRHQRSTRHASHCRP